MSEDPNDKDVETEEPEKDVDDKEPDKEPEKDPEKADDKEPAPVKYELAMPKDSLLAPSVIDEIVSYAKDQGLSNEAAQKILNRESKAVAGYQEDKKAEVEEIRKGWQGEVKADKELGGENYERSAEISQRVIARFGTPKLIEIMEDTRFGDHPEFVRFTKRIGEIMTDDQFVKAQSKPAGKDRSDADVLFGTPSGDSPTT